jgi:hypothetical protein
MSDDGTTVACPVEGCAFRDTASLVAAHVNGSGAADHDWGALRFGGPRDFLQQARRGWLTDEDGGVATPDGEQATTPGDGRAATPDDEVAAGTESSSETGESKPTGSGTTTGSSDPGPVPAGEVRCPADGCHYTGELASVKAHVSGTHDAAHDAGRLRERGVYPTVDDVKGGAGPADADRDTSTAPATATASEESPDVGAAAGTAAADDTTPTAEDRRLTGDTTVAELLDLLDTTEFPVDTDAVETALVLCDLLAGVDDDPDARTLVDAYTLASDLAAEACDARTDLRDELLDRTDTDGELAGDLGRVRRVTRTRRSLRADDEVLARLREAGVDPDTVLRPDATRVRETLDAADLPESLAFDVTESSYVRKADSDADARRARLAALCRRSEE